MTEREREQVKKEKREAICDLISRHGKRFFEMCEKHNIPTDITKINIFAVAFLQVELSKKIRRAA